MQTIPRLVAIEGPECSGKTRLFNTLKSYFSSRETFFYEETARCLARKGFQLGINADAKTEVALLAMTASQMTIADQNVKKGKMVIADRCWVSQIVYSRTRKKLQHQYDFNPDFFSLLEDILFTLLPELLKRTIIIYLDIPPYVSLERRHKQKSPLRTRCSPDLKWFEQTYKEYNECLTKLRERDILVKNINANQQPAEILSEFLEICRKAGGNL